jgi:hypothetical protein
VAVAELVRQYGPALLAWVVLACLRPGPAPGRRLVWLCVFGLAISQSALTPVGDALIVGDDSERLVGHLGMLLAVWAGARFVLWLHGSPARLLTVYSAATAAALCVAFALTPDLFPQSPWVMEYCIVYAVAQLPSFAVMAWLCLREARRTDDRVLRTGLGLVTAGVVAAACYIVDKTVVAVSARADFTFPAGKEFLLSRALPTTAHLLVLVGVGLPALVDWIRRCRQYRRLGPLWHALYRAEPSIALDPPALFPTSMRLYRRVIEIRDGLLALQPYRSAEITEGARRSAAEAGLRGDRLEAAVEAAVVAEALRARSAGVEPLPPRTAVVGGEDLGSDTEFLSHVAHAYRLRTKDGAVRHDVPTGTGPTSELSTGQRPS